MVVGSLKSPGFIWIDRSQRQTAQAPTARRRDSDGVLTIFRFLNRSVLGVPKEQLATTLSVCGHHVSFFSPVIALWPVAGFLASIEAVCRLMTVLTFSVVAGRHLYPLQSRSVFGGYLDVWPVRSVAAVFVG